MDEATARAGAQELLSKMRGEGWRVRVWENLGWHYCVSTDVVAVYPSGQKYSCLMGRQGTGTGLGIWTLKGSFDDPNEAVAAQVEEAERVVDDLFEIIRKAKVGFDVDAVEDIVEYPDPSCGYCRRGYTCLNPNCRTHDAVPVQIAGQMRLY